MARTEPLRGEVWLVDFGLAAKVRPALVVSEPYGDDDRALIGVIPHTTSLRGSKYEIKVAARFLRREGAFLIQGLATVPPAYFGRKLGGLTDAQMTEIEDGLQGWLGL